MLCVFLFGLKRRFGFVFGLVKRLFWFEIAVKAVVCYGFLVWSCGMGGLSLLSNVALLTPRPSQGLLFGIYIKNHQKTSS